MLSEQSAPVVRATLPVVSGAIDEIAGAFYRRLFEAHPELLRDVFNRGHQTSGEQRKALAGSITAFAGMLIERPDTRPDALLDRIAHKHVSLGITSEQYKVVHRHLFAAIAEVLGEAVSPRVAAAWDEVYWLMANALIAVETRLYAEAGVPEGEVWRPMIIAERQDETPDIASFVLRRPDGAPAGTYRPGQYVSVQVTLPDGARQIRQYSLSSAPGDQQWRITVKRIRDAAGSPEGEVSTWLHSNARPGDELTVSAPSGDLVLSDGDGPLLLASAGIGSTPMLAILGHLARTAPHRRVDVVHADRSLVDHAHREELHQLVDAMPGAALHLWYEQGPAPEPRARRGRADITALGILAGAPSPGASPLPARLTAYLCGPLPFMRAVRGDLLHAGVPAQAVHYEVFGPDLWLSAA